MGKRIPVIIGLILVLLGIWVQITSVSYVRHWLTELENIAYDIQLRAKFVKQKQTKLFDTSVAIVDIDDNSIKTLGRWPWQRQVLATLINRIQEQGAAVIALDVLFSEKENNIATIVLDQMNKENLLPTQTLEPLIKKIEPYFDNDIKFAEALGKIDSVLSITFVPYTTAQGMITPPISQLTTSLEKQLSFCHFNGFIANIPILQQAAKSAGFINVFADDDGVVRRSPLLINYKDGLYPSLALEAARLYLLSNIELVTAPYGQSRRLEGIKIAGHVVPTDDKSQVIIPYQGYSYTFPYYSAVDVLNKKIPQNAFSGKIVFIGTSAIGLADLKPTSVQNIFPGVEIQATIADGLLKNNFSFMPDWAIGMQIVFTILAGVLFTFVFPYFGPRILTLLIILCPPVFIYLNNWVWIKTGFIISILVPILLVILIGMVNVLYGYFFESRRRERLKEMFGQYVPEEHIDEMLQTTSNYGLYGEEREMTALFADIRDFTTISESLSASQLKDFLHEVFTPMTEIIFKHRGTIDKYVGDLIMAFWGAPLKDEKHAENAIDAAINMQKKLIELNPFLASKEWPEIKIGIGINSGLMNVGDMGSQFRRNYTVLGDAVNLASRIEGLTKHYGVNCIAAENSIANQNNFIFRELDRVRVKGKKTGISIFEIVCRRSELTPALKNELEMSEIALNYYYQQQWDKAHALFSQLNATYPNTPLYHLYLNRITQFEKTPPPADWNGIYIHKDK